MVRRSSGAAGGGGGRRGGWEEPAPSLTPSASGPFRTSSADLLWRPSLFTGRTRAGTRRSGASGTTLLGRLGSAQHIRLDQVIPAAGSTHFHDVHRELVEAGG